MFRGLGVYLLYWVLEYYTLILPLVLGSYHSYLYLESIYLFSGVYSGIYPMPYGVRRFSRTRLQTSTLNTPMFQPSGVYCIGFRV